MQSDRSRIAGLPGKDSKPVMISVFNSGYLIALLLFLAGSISSFCDGVIASKGLGVAELAAIGIVYPYTKTMECISLVFSSGSQVIIGRKIGQNRFDEVSKVFYTSLSFVGVLSIIIAVLIVILARPVSLLFGASVSGGTLSPTTDYLVSLAVGAPAHLLTLYMIPLFQLDEKKRLVSMVMIVMTAVNVSLNILFLINGMGIKGIGYSTSVSYYVALIMLSTHFLGEKRGVLLRGKFALCREYLSETVREGAPSAFKNISSIIFNTAVNNMIAVWCSTAAMAAFSVFKMTKFIFLSVSEAIISPVRMIQSMLREEKDRTMTVKIFGYSMLKGTLLSAAFSAVLLVFGRQIFSFMVSGPVLDETVSLMRWAAVVFILNTVVCYYLAYFQVIRKNRLVYSISVVLNLVTIPVFYVLARAMGSEGVWISFAIQFIIVAAYVTLCALYMGRRNKRLIDKLLVLPAADTADHLTYDYHIGSEGDAREAATAFGGICSQNISDPKKAFFCSLALEELVFNILACQKAGNEPDPNIDVHIVICGEDKMIMRIKDCSSERNPFVKYEYNSEDDELENLGIKIVKSFASDIKYSFIYGVNFITITV